VDANCGCSETGRCGCIGTGPEIMRQPAPSLSLEEQARKVFALVGIDYDEFLAESDPMPQAERHAALLARASAKHYFVKGERV